METENKARARRQRLMTEGRWLRTAESRTKE